MKKYLYIIVLIVTFSSCEKDITVSLPTPSSKVVVDGYVETGLPPYIILSRNQGYFEPINSTTINNAAETGATVIISDGAVTDTLSEIDTTYNGYTIKGAYIADPLKMIGVPGRTYTLSIITKKGERVSASSKLELPVPLDSTWFEVAENQTELGFIWAKLSDPDTLGNAYRWFAKRLTKDNLFIAPQGSVFEDKFINGQSFNFAYNRGSLQNSTATDDNNEEAGFFKKGDTVVVKFCAIGKGTYDFWRDAETQLANSGSPFAVPSNIKSNISGGLGVFSTYSPFIDTVYAK